MFSKELFKRYQSNLKYDLFEMRKIVFIKVKNIEINHKTKQKTVFISPGQMIKIKKSLLFTTKFSDII